MNHLYTEHYIEGQWSQKKYLYISSTLDVKASTDLDRIIVELKRQLLPWWFEV